MTQYEKKKNFIVNHTVKWNQLNWHTIRIPIIAAAIGMITVKWDTKTSFTVFIFLRCAWFFLHSFANWLRYQISSYYFECKTNCNRKRPVESYKSCTFHGRATNILYVHSITQQFQRWRKYIHALSRDCRYMLWLLTPIQWHRGTCSFSPSLVVVLFDE